MRLIDADKLKEYHCRKMCDDIPCPIPCDVVRWIDEQPTAYNIDNVVEQLEEITIVTDYGEVVYCNLDSYGSMDCPTKDCHYCLINKAIEIVKGGADNA